MHVTEEEADKTVEQFAEAIQSAEKLSFLDEQQIYDLERQFHAQQSRLSEAQTALAERESRLSDAQRRIGEITAVLQAEKEEAAKERETPQWKVLSIPAGEMDSARESDCKEGSKSSFRKPWRNETASGSWLWRTENDLSCTQECETCSKSSWEKP